MKNAIGLGLVAILAVACGGANGSSSTARRSNDIKSMPPYPASPPPAAKNHADTPDPKAICAEAKPIQPKKALLEKDPNDGSRPSSRNAKDTPYKVADLEALDKKGQYEELLAHAEDIPPSQRSPGWEKLVTKAAAEYMQSLNSPSSAAEGVWTSQALVKRYPFLTKSDEFMSKRAEAAKTASDRCLADSYRGQHCIDMMKELLQTTGTSPDVGFQLGKITRRHMNPYVAVPFFKWAIDQKKDSSYCGDDDLKLAVVAGLGLPPDYADAADARAIATSTCWDQVKDDAKKALVDSPTGYVRDNTCAVMKAKGEL